ncbi:hypothetical protein [Sedimentitalea sp.]|uniref:hypothetical protein n=1 Tax=Sedimentitalea sp. TaxID=2048915 RepID=UPI003297C94C
MIGFGVRVLLLVVTSLVLVSTLVSAEQAVRDFEFAGKVSQRGHQDYSVRIWNDGQVMYIDYPDLNCGGSVLLHQQTKSAIEFNETLNRGTGACGHGGFIELTQLDGDQWMYQWSRRRGADPIVGGVVTLSLSAALSKPSRQAEVEPEKAPDETATPTEVTTETDIAPNAEPDMPGSHDFQISGHIGRGGSPDYLVVITVIGNEAFVEYPDLGCSNILIVPDHVESVLPYLMERGGVRLTETAAGPECPAGSKISITNWDSSKTKWSIGRGIGISGHGMMMSSEPTTLKTGNISKPKNLAALKPLPPGTAAVDANLGIFLGKGPSQKGIGPTSLVLAVEPDSAAAQAGIAANDLLLIVDNGAGEPLSHVQMINSALEQRGRVEVHVKKSSGDRVILTIQALPKSAEDGELAIGNKMARQIHAGQFDDAYGFDRFDQRVRMAIEMRALVLLYAHERAYIEACSASISEPTSAFEARLDLVTTKNGVEVDRDVGGAETVRYRTRFREPFLEAYANLSRPVTMISYLGPDYIGTASELEVDARQIVTATGCETSLSEEFSNNLAEFVEQGTSLP